MRRYETITIIDPDLSEEGRQPVLERVESLIPEHKGLLVETDEWGARKLAYEIKKKVRGYYVRFDYCGTGGLVDEIERFFRIDDRVLKYMTILSEENVDLEKIKETIAAAAEAKKQKKASEAAASKAAASKAAASKAAAPEAPPASDSTGSPVPAEAETAATGETASAEDKTEQAVEQNQTDEAATQPQDETTEAAETAESTETAETDPEPAPSAEAAEEKASAEQPAAAETAEPETDTETEKK